MTKLNITKMVLETIWNIDSVITSGNKHLTYIIDLTIQNLNCDILSVFFQEALALYLFKKKYFYLFVYLSSPPMPSGSFCDSREYGGPLS